VQVQRSGGLSPVGTEDADIRVISTQRKVDDSYANGYDNSKWASEVLLREANDLCGLPVAVFRCDMILADTTYQGQLNVPDMFTRLLFSLVATGIAPYSLYELDAHGHRQRAHYDGIGLDEYVDWLIEAGNPIARITDYGSWLGRFETAMRALPARQRAHSWLPLLHNHHRPEKPLNGPMAPTTRFRAAVQDAKIGPDKDIPHIRAPIIVKYISDLHQLGLL
jgi:fatty acid CoA ligase FadD9